MPIAASLWTLGLKPANILPNYDQRKQEQFVSKSEEPKSVLIRVVLPSTGFRRAMFFNRFRIEREDDFTVFHCGLLSKSGFLVDSYCCVIPSEALESNKKNLLEYYGRIGESKTSVLPWPGVPSSQKSDIVDLIEMTFNGKLAETNLIMYSHTAAYRTAKEEKPGGELIIQGQPVAILRSSSETQRQFIRALYE